ncbi:FtsX-like permease family protein [Oscillatoria sp. FACHB-1407]|uniref:ABC transporter permease DevC n=1 Tax=Oscillatoria sp. FACHB-1407 TaxID=2692847 RepID=UPI001687E4EA|nr:ABC transporter permease DevC [Oscillatoria sp. FACHB-1407]MBD2463537.1 FtsX-like permease family protein [Oscillatoria sp. FACHB-1407]
MMRKLFRKTPLAWLQVRRERTRLLVAIAGIAFADILIFFQLGLMESAYVSATGMHYRLQGDLFLINAISDNVNTIRPFPRSRLFQAVGTDGIASVNTLYTGIGNWRNPNNRTFWQVQIYGLNPSNPAMDVPDARAKLSQLKMLNYVLYDRAARPNLGDVAGQLERSNSLTAQLNNVTIQVAGVFTMGASFSADGNLIVSDSTFLRLFPERQPDEIDVGLIVLEPGANLEQVQAVLRAKLPDDVLVLTKAEYIAREREYWSQVSPIGVIFGFGTIVGFLVGTVIVYQILYSDVSDHLPEYATLKAMGYSDRYLIGVLFQEALILAILGFIPGFAISLGLYGLISQATLLPVRMSVNRATLVLIMTLLMCIASGAIAMRKLQSADPADIF